MIAALTKGLEHLTTAIREVRNIVNNLRPSMLEEFGLVATLELLCHELQVSQPSLNVGCNIDDANARLTTSLCVAMVRILLEALNNVSKHAAADSVTVTVRLDPSEASLAVIDNGRGFDPAQLGSKGFGLAGMRERVDRSGGIMKIKSRPGEGTSIHISWPLDDSDDTSISGTHKAIRYGVRRDGGGVA